MAAHSSVLAWRIPGTEEPGGLPSMGSHRVRHDWSDLAAATAGSYGWKASLGMTRFPCKRNENLFMHCKQFPMAESKQAQRGWTGAAGLQSKQEGLDAVTGPRVRQWYLVLSWWRGGRKWWWWHGIPCVGRWRIRFRSQLRARGWMNRSTFHWGAEEGNGRFREKDVRSKSVLSLWSLSFFPSKSLRQRATHCLVKISIFSSELLPTSAIVGHASLLSF